MRLNSSCNLCPRQCGVDRKHKAGFCGEKQTVRLAYAGLHYGEEPCLVSSPPALSRGSGTVFFTGCTLKCVFCQNMQISQSNIGRALCCDELAVVFLDLQKAGAANLNLVTATHFYPQIIKALRSARAQGLKLPVVWNCSGFDTSGALKDLQEHVDIYLPDLKTLDREIARLYFKAPSYPQIACQAINEMVRQKPLIWAADSLRQGVIVRHLVLPGHVKASIEVLRYFSRYFKDRALISLMFQYRPADKGGPARRLSRCEYKEVMEGLYALELDNGYVQEYGDESEWSPDFTRINPFASQLSQPVWHYSSSGSGKNAQDALKSRV